MKEGKTQRDKERERELCTKEEEPNASMIHSSLFLHDFSEKEKRPEANWRNRSSEPEEFHFRHFMNWWNQEMWRIKLVSDTS